MANNPVFSIVIPTYNRADKLKRALISIDKQSFKNFEVIVCDDGSTDHTKRIINDFCNKFDIKYIWQEHWGGPARPRNNGINNARGEYIAFLDADDWWYPNKLKIAKEHLNGTDILYHDLDIYTKSGKMLFKKFKGRNLKKPVFVDLMRNENALINSSVVVRKDIVERAGGLIEDKTLVSLEDFDLWLKISRVTEKFTYIPKSLGAYWLGKENISSASEEKIERLNRLYDRYLPFLIVKDKEQAKMLMSYLMARTKQKIGLLDEALQLFRFSAKSKNMRIKIRSICWVVLLSIFNNFSERRM